MDNVIRKNVYEVEASVLTSHTVSAPLAVIIPPSFPGFITGVLAYAQNSPGSTYFRIRTIDGRLLYPGGTGAPINAAVPAGWATAADKIIADLSIPVGDTDLVVEFCNHGSGTCIAYVAIWIAQDTIENLIYRLIEAIKDDKPRNVA